MRKLAIFFILLAALLPISFSCTKGATRCSGDMLQICNSSLSWQDSADCAASGNICATYNSTLAKCQQYLCNEKETRCNPSNSEELQQCINNVWAFSDYCPDGCYAGACKTIEPKTATCYDGQHRCSGNYLQECIGAKWRTLYACPSGRYCNDGVCVEKQTSTTTKKDIIYDEPCTNWTSWSKNATQTVHEYLEDGSKITCTNTTYVRYCLRDKNKKDYTTYQFSHNYTCPPSKECAYVLQTSQEIMDYADGWCKDCTKETFIYVCNSSSGIIYGDVLENTTCSQIRACTEAELGVYGGAIPANPSSSDALAAQFSGWAVLAGVLLVCALVYAIWKLFFPAKEA